MTNISITISREELLSISNELRTYEIGSSNEYVLKTYKFQECTINIYKTMVLVIQGKNCEKVYMQLFKKPYQEIDIKDLNIEKHISVNQNNISTMGSDEVGVGDFFGGIVVVSAYITKDQIEWLKSIGVKDSKLLSDEKICSLYEILKENIKFDVINLYPSEYNYQYEKFLNSHIIKAVAHNQALWNLSKISTRPYFVIMDQFVSADNYSQYLRKANKSEFSVDIFETKAESKYLCVACASIIARYMFIEQIRNLSNELGINLPLGSSNENIKIVAKNIIDKYGVEKLDQVCKKHFITYKEILGE